MDFIELEMRSIKEIPAADLNSLSRNIRGRCDRNESRTVVYFLVSLFSGLVPVVGFREIISTSDHMGSLDIKLHLISGDYYLKLDYEQSITSTWQHVERDRFSQENFLPPGVSLRFDLDLTTSGWMTINLYGIDDSTAQRITGLACKCFEKVKPAGAPDPEIEEFIKNLKPLPEPQPVQETPPQPHPVTPLEKLIAVFDQERNGYMEWHDGPSLHEVDYAFSALAPEEKTAASAIIAERIRKNYDAYLGRAAELLGSEECRRALHDVLASANSPYTASNIARNLLTMGESREAIDIFKRIIENRTLGWSVRIDTLVHLKIAMDSAGDKRPLPEFVPPELEAAIFEAVCDDDYLVRYHAAETVLKLAGEKKSPDKTEDLFGYICGKSGTDRKPDKADREGFKKAAEMLRAMLMKKK